MGRRDRSPPWFGRGAAALDRGRPDTVAPEFDASTLNAQTVLGNCDGSPVTFSYPLATDGCQAAYGDAHGGELDERQIREALATELQESYPRRVRAYFDALRTNAVTE